MNLIDDVNTILAALKPSQYRKYWKIWNAKFRNRYNEIFGDKNRIYLTYETDNKFDIDNKYLEEMKKINSWSKLCELNYEIRNIEDYIEGYAYNIKGQKAKITKLINKMIDWVSKSESLLNTTKKEKTDLLNSFMSTFNQRPSFKQLDKPKLICISRHPYDIAGMSTDRRWTSCMRLPTPKDPTGGAYYQKIENDINYGTLTAYLIYEEDKNIKNPIARINIKPYQNIEDPTDILLVSEPIVYSDNKLNKFDNFVKIIDTWLESFQGKKLGIYKFNTELYAERGSSKLMQKIEPNKQIYNYNIKNNTISKGIKIMTLPIFQTLQMSNCEIRNDLKFIEISDGVIEKGTFMTLDTVEFSNCDFKLCGMNGVHILNCTIYNGVFTRDEIYGTDIHDGYFTDINITHTTINHGYFYNCNLTNANIYGGVFYNCKFKGQTFFNGGLYFNNVIRTKSSFTWIKGNWLSGAFSDISTQYMYYGISPIIYKKLRDKYAKNKSIDSDEFQIFVEKLEELSNNSLYNKEVIDKEKSKFFNHVDNKYGDIIKQLHINKIKQYEKENEVEGVDDEDS